MYVVQLLVQVLLSETTSSYVPYRTVRILNRPTVYKYASTSSTRTVLVVMELAQVLVILEYEMPDKKSSVGVTTS